MLRVYAHIPVLPLDELRALPEGGQHDSGLYFLWQGDALAYVGKAIDVGQRHDIHRRLDTQPEPDFCVQGSKPHDRHTCLVLDSGLEKDRGTPIRMVEYERKYIAYYKPPLNSLSGAGN